MTPEIIEDRISFDDQSLSNEPPASIASSKTGTAQCAKLREEIAALKDEAIRWASLERQIALDCMTRRAAIAERLPVAEIPAVFPRLSRKIETLPQNVEAERRVAEKIAALTATKPRPIPSDPLEAMLAAEEQPVLTVIRTDDPDIIQREAIRALHRATSTLQRRAERGLNGVDDADNVGTLMQRRQSRGLNDQSELSEGARLIIESQKHIFGGTQ